MEYAYQVLENEISNLEKEISVESDLERKAELIGNKNILVCSVKLLKKCEQHEIWPTSIFTTLPAQECPTPSSDYRIMEDCESEDPQYWIEAKISKAQFGHVRLHEGDVVIEK